MSSHGFAWGFFRTARSVALTLDLMIQNLLIRSLGDTITHWSRWSPIKWSLWGRGCSSVVGRLLCYHTQDPRLEALPLPPPKKTERGKSPSEGYCDGRKWFLRHKQHIIHQNLIGEGGNHANQSTNYKELFSFTKFSFCHHYDYLNTVKYLTS
jgi:hypothetical protein